ncbi:hypothetical protein NM208_g11586 [Fusarium decemcellulare]|uniref:Uncharacterized protein n=1 Tax=Fusarium decemcellulare TaxID=57161 RepID=A0ACC1RU72_9HYPO|nr:hypothetical protein NM208_g11586 [Fusarium decemcellulare]
MTSNHQQPLELHQDGAVYKLLHPQLYNTLTQNEGSHWHEFLLSEPFWILACIIVANNWWTTYQMYEDPDSYKEPDEEQGRSSTIQQIPWDSPAACNLRLMKRWPHFEWALDYITSRPRQYFAIVMCTLIFPVQLLEGYWLVVMATRLTILFYNDLYPRWKPYTLGFILYLPATTTVLTAWCVLLLVGFVLLVLQFEYVLALLDIYPGAHHTPNGLIDDLINLQHEDHEQGIPQDTSTEDQTTGDEDMDADDEDSDTEEEDWEMDAEEELEEEPE